MGVIFPRIITQDETGNLGGLNKKKKIKKK